jgi:outer membrane protein assembly factor BamE (lipoprotein component of BamABCDE complex)
LKSALATLAAAAACVAGLAGCVTPQTYDDVHVSDWTRERIEQQFPEGTTKKHVFAELGGPFEDHSGNGVTRWDYVGGVSSQRHVWFLFRDGKLVEKQFVNF